MRLHEGRQTAALARAFLGRFFENEITAGSNDLKTSFFWLLAFLMLPGLFISSQMLMAWDLIARLHGPEVLRVVSRGDKALYLGFTMVAAGVITAITWSSLLIDRRDALILGVMPVRPAVVVRAKLAALGFYILLIAIGMHTIASIVFGTLLASRAPFEFLLRSLVAHFVVSCAAGAFVLLSVAGIQGLALSVAGPRMFARVAPVLQLAIVGAVALGFLLLPTLNVSVADTLREAGRSTRPWLLLTPPLWFLGAYEWVLGTDDPTLLSLARRAWLALAAAAMATVVSYPLAYRRLMASAVQGPGGTGRRGRLVETLARGVGRRPGVRAAAAFFLSSAGRLERQRFVIATALGVAAAWGLPVLLGLLRGLPEEPTRALLSLPIAAMIFMAVGLRTAGALPADVGAGWLFELQRPARHDVHTALERTMFAFGILPVVIAGAGMCGALWGARIAVVHGLLLTSVGVLFIQMLLWRSAAMPCAQPWEPERLDLKRKAWLYLGMFLVFSGAVPTVELALLPSATASGSLILALAAAAVAVRYVSLRLPPLEGAEGTPDSEAVVLRLSA